MVEQADSCEAHDHVVGVAGLDDVVIPDTSAGLCDILHAASESSLDVVSEGEERVGTECNIGISVKPCSLFLCSEDCGFLCEERLPLSVRQNIHVLIPYVEVYAQGSEEAVDKFLTAIEQEPPERASILKLTRQRLDEDRHYQDFQIIESAKEKGSIFVSPDIATCDKCRAELFDPQDKRYLHPFINCTACGPRLTILDSMPYDRERTSMGEFPMCPSCQAEYDSPSTRRYDAQPVCCNDCGPEVYIIGEENVRGAAAITRTRQTIINGGIVAIKGIGGFHLCCDATNEQAVLRLRQLKHRPVKPFAIMARDMAAIKRECFVENGQKEILTGHQKPILLLKRKMTGQIQDVVAPGNPKIGIMLPYAPLHMLLFDYRTGWLCQTR